MLKAEIRKKYRVLRQKLSTDDVEKRSLDIANLALQLPIWEKTYYHLFLSIDEQKEVDTHFLLTILQGKDKKIVIPKITIDGALSHHLLTENTILKKNSWNIPEPVGENIINTSKIEVVFIPLLAFDKNGHRVGYGKGFYDGFLAKCNPKTIKIGLSFFEPEEKIDNVYTTDIKLDYVVTPQQIYAFSS